MKTILVPTDFSVNAGIALRYAIQLSKEIKAGLILYHCTNLPPFLLASAAVSNERMLELTKEDAAFKSKKMAQQASRAYKYLGFKNVPDSAKLIVESNPMLVESIIAFSVKMKADIIITGTHGATGLNRFFFGSNTANLISKSEIPVLAIPEKYRFKPVRKIVLSTDLEQLEYELKCFMPIAQSVNASVDLMYFDYGIDVKGKLVAKAESLLKKYGKSKLRLIKKPATIEYSFMKQLKKQVDGSSYQWLVMFTRERSFWEKIFLWSKTENLSYTIKLPLLSFRKKP